MATGYSIMSLCAWLPLILISHFIPTLSQSDNYIVHMDVSVMPKAFSNRHSWYLSILSAVLDASRGSTSSTGATTTLSTSSRLLYSYNHVISGFSVSLTASELEALKSSPGYISSSKDLPVKPDTTHSNQFLGLSSQSGVWKEYNYGEGVIIGVVDTGVWPESESYDDNGMPEVPETWKGACESGTKFNSSMCNKKLIGARFFNKGLIAKYPNTTISMNSARDTDGHGTHTSSTAAGNFVAGASFFGYASGTASGVAPRAHVAMYKALWDEGSYVSDIIAAIDQAISDGVDVVSLSLGLDGVPFHEDPIALATFAAMEKNIFVSTSAGNEGPFFSTLHNGTPWVLTVAAGNMDREFAAVLTLGNGIPIFGSSLYVGNFSSGQFPIVFMDACLDLKELSKHGQSIVVCENKKDSLVTQIDNIQKANVTGGVFITNLTEVEFIQNPFAAVFMNPTDGEAIKDYITNNKDPQGTLEFKRTKLGIKGAPSVTSYSSRGPSPSCPFVLKPDIMAPGSLVLAAWPQNIEVANINSQSLFSNFNLLSGTSMSCPHLAGVAALLRKAHPEWSPAAIRSALMTTADTMDNTREPIKDDNKPATPLAIGAGQVNPNKALDPGLIYDADSTDYVKLICALNYTDEQIKIITGSSSNNCSSKSLDLNYPSFIAFFKANNSKSDAIAVQEFRRTTTNVGEPVATYTAYITGMRGFKVSVEPAKLEFKAKNEKLSYNLSIEAPSSLNDPVTFGYLSWVDVGAKHVVKSPIVATSLSPDTLSSTSKN